MTKSDKTPDATTRGVAALTQTMLAANPAMAKVWAEIASESARFVSERLQEDLKAQAAMLACKSPAELAKLQTEFFQTAMTQYTEEAHRMVEIMTEATDEAVKEAKSGAARDYDDVPV